VKRGAGVEVGEPPSRELKRSIVEHYERQLARYGPTPRGMDWKDSASQRLRFEILTGPFRLDGMRVHEVGCGAGHLVDWLAERGASARYTGSDLSQAMVESARARHPDVHFERRDILEEARDDRYDLVLCSGLFHVKLGRSSEEWQAFVRCCLRRMYQMCRVAIAFNLMSDQVDFRKSELYYADLGDTLDFCRQELSRYVSLRHDYPLYEATFHVHRNPAAG